MILAADLGGTKTSLALFSSASLAVPLRETTVASRRHESFDEILATFLDAAEARPLAACLAVAGPVAEGRSAITNLPWVIDSAAIARRLGVAAERVQLVNDLVATAWGLAEVSPARIVTVRHGEADRSGGALLLGLGTGLGVALLTREVEGRGDGPGWPFRARPSEGGHVDLAARNAIEDRILSRLRRRFGPVSVERVLSGPGLLHLYEALRDEGFAPQADEVGQRLAADADPAATIHAAARQGDPLAKAALGAFLSFLGATAGNFALITLATGGVYLAGGIPPKILPELRDEPWLEAFDDKGPLRSLLARIPIHVVLEPRAALLGAARRALDLAPRPL